MNRNWVRRLAAITLAACLVPLAQAQAPLPSAVDLTPWQSPVKNQGDRDTCGTFASIAALEALYKRRYGVTLDLSEQYLNHWAQQSAFGGPGALLPYNETNAGSIGGGGLARPLGALRRGLAVPSEALLPYIPVGQYQNDDEGDVPRLNDFWNKHLQRDIDDFNLADQPASAIYAPPTAVWTAVMPQAALDAARYKPTGVTHFTGAEVNNVDKYRSVLAGGREVVMEFRCCDGNPGYGSTQPWTLPAASSGGAGGHVVAVVGYDDPRQMFRIKNSYGTAWGDQGYAWVSYDLVRRAAVKAAYLADVVSPWLAFDPFNFRHLFLGRWQLNYDGWKGVLDIYNLPETPNGTGNLVQRIGTLFLANGQAYRVNGSISGNALQAYVDWANADMPMTQLSGAQFTLRLFTYDHRAMAGTLRDALGTFAVAAVKGTLPFTGSAAPGGLGLSSYLGTWDFSHDGWKGRLEVTSADPVTRKLSGRYVDINGRAFALSGVVNADARLFSLTIDFGVLQPFNGHLNGRERGVMAGFTTQGGLSFGFMGSRRP